MRPELSLHVQLQIATLNVLTLLNSLHHSAHSSTVTVKTVKFAEGDAVIIIALYFLTRLIKLDELNSLSTTNMKVYQLNK